MTRTPTAGGDAYDRTLGTWMFHGPMTAGDILVARNAERAFWATGFTPAPTGTLVPTATLAVTPTPITSWVAVLGCSGAVTGCVTPGPGVVITLNVPTPVLTATLAATATVQATGTLPPTATLAPTVTPISSWVAAVYCSGAITGCVTPGPGVVMTLDVPTAVLTATVQATGTLPPTATLAPTATVQAYPTAPPTPVSTVSASVITITSSQAAGTEGVVLCDATSGAVVYTLPAAASSSQRVIRFKKTDTSKNKCTLDGNASELIDGSLTLDISTKSTAVDIICNGTAWFIF